MSAISRAHPVYLHSGAGWLFGSFHLPSEGSARDVAVLMCSPFGWEETASYRSRRVWAERLAAAGYPTLRFDLPGTGDSGGSADDPDRVEMWSAAVLDAARWLREASGARRVAAAGIGLGGFLAARAAARGAPIDDLVLWAAPARGRALVRELRAFASLEASAREAAEEAFASSVSDRPRRPPLADGAIEAGGFVLRGDTVRALEGIDLSEEPLSAGGARRALLLGRDGVAVDSRLRVWLEDAGVEVSVDAGEGYAEMTDMPYRAKAPDGVIERMAGWLEEEAGPGDGVTRVPLRGSEGQGEGVVLGAVGARVREEAFAVEVGSYRLEGILTRPFDRPPADLCAIYTNVGAVRRAGPGRMWSEATRRWAGRGVPCLRIDVAGIGDSEGDASRYADIAGLYLPEFAEQLAAIVSALAARGVARRFMIVGLCSSAYWGFRCALRDTRVESVVLINPAALVWDPGLVAAREARKLLKLRHASQWQRIARGGVRREIALGVLRGTTRLLVRGVLAAPERLATSRRSRRAGGDEIDRALDRLRERDQRLVLVFCSLGEQLRDELGRQRRLPPAERWPNMELELIPGYDHMLRPRAMQQAAHEILDRALERELARASEGAHPAPIELDEGRTTVTR